MNAGKTLFAQIMDFLPWTTFNRYVEKYNGDCGVRTMTCAEQFRIMAFAQLTYRESLRDIEVCLGAQVGKLYHMGFRGTMKRSTLADANESRDWRIYADFGRRLIVQARALYTKDDLGLDLSNTVYALDSTTIDLCLSVFPWAHFRTTKAAVKMHTLLDLESLVIESDVPIMGESFDPSTGKEKTKQLGLVTLVQTLDQAFVDHLSLLTNTKISVFISQKARGGGTVTYRDSDWNTAQQGGGRNLTATKIEREGYYQRLISLYTDKHLVGAIVALRSREIVRKNTWEMIRILGLIAVASLMLTLPFAWYFASSISRPLNILSRIFRGVGSGNQIGPLSDGQLKQLEKETMRDDELGDLTQSFIAMNDAVNQKIQQINEINASLEHKIGKRTAELGLAKEMAESVNRKLAEKNALLENMNIMLQHNEVVLRNSEELLRETQIIAGLSTYVMDVSTGRWKSSDVLDMLFGINETYQRTAEGWAGLVHPDDRMRLVDYLKNEVFDQCKAFDMEYRIIRHDDQAERWLHGVGKLEYDVQGRPSKMLCAVQDITEQREREAELVANRELLHDIEKRQTLSRERQRLMQDMHDGLGSSLISALSVVEHGRMSQAEIAQVLMGCIDDLKLAIDSMEPMEADLLLLLATLRFRLGPRLENIGITLRWEIENVPALDWLDPRNALHILRILQEAFTNIIKHAHATEIRVATKVENNYVAVTVTDNGQGFSLAHALKNGGKGLFNQMRRAESIGAEICLDSNNEVGTRLTLRLPIKRKYAAE